MRSSLAASNAPVIVADQQDERDLGRLIDELLGSLKQAIVEIEQINFQTKLLSLNARIEAARAGGTVGAAFGIVAQEIQSLARNTGEVTTKLSEDSRQTILKIQTEVDSLSTNARGSRLADLALSNVDLIDRNLYERSCDVRWWATDSRIVEAVTSKTLDACHHASERLAVILHSYTVYYDLVVCDLNGVVIANGRPERYHSRGANQANSRWFQNALTTRNGDQFAFQTAHHSTLVDGEPALIYACGIRENGDTRGKLLGVLGVIFNWAALGQTIVEKHQSAGDQTRFIVCDHDGVILADTDRTKFGQQLNLPDFSQMLSEKKGFRITELDGQPMCIAYALAPGYETYTTGGIASSCSRRLSKLAGYSRSGWGKFG
ncbi:methyl-accepting chemotaxis protein [Lacunimicrobium album]